LWKPDTDIRHELSLSGGRYSRAVIFSNFLGADLGEIASPLNKRLIFQ
jgi:hypothetical protein